MADFRAQSDFKDFMLKNEITVSLVANSVSVGNVGGGEDTLKTLTIPRLTLYKDGVYGHGVAWGKFAANANSKRVKVKTGSVTLLDSGAGAFNGQSWDVEFWLMRSGDSAAEGLFLFRSGATSVRAYPSTVHDFGSDIGIVVTGEGVATDDVIAKAATLDATGAK